MNIKKYKLFYRQIKPISRVSNPISGRKYGPERITYSERRSARRLRSETTIRVVE